MLESNNQKPSTFSYDQYIHDADEQILEAGIIEAEELLKAYEEDKGIINIDLDAKKVDLDRKKGGEINIDPK